MRVVQEGVPGEFAKLGVWRGGTCIYARALLNLLRVREPHADKRKVLLFDVFGRMGQNGQHASVLGVSKEAVLLNFAKYGLLSRQMMKTTSDNTASSFTRGSSHIRRSPSGRKRCNGARRVERRDASPCCASMAISTTRTRTRSKRCGISCPPEGSSSSTRISSGSAALCE